MILETDLFIFPAVNLNDTDDKKKYCSSFSFTSSAVKYFRRKSKLATPSDAAHYKRNRMQLHVTT